MRVRWVWLVGDGRIAASINPQHIVRSQDSAACFPGEVLDRIPIRVRVWRISRLQVGDGRQVALGSQLRSSIGLRSASRSAANSLARCRYGGSGSLGTATRAVLLHPLPSDL